MSAKSTSNQARAVNFLQSGSGASARTVQAKLRDVHHIKDFGAVCDGTTDDTAACAAAITAAASGTLIWTGTPRITSGLTITQGRHVFDGRLGINSSFRPGSYIIKDDTVSGAALTITGAAWLQGGGVVAEEGNSGVNITISANSARWDNGYSENAGSHGWFIDGATNNSNRVMLTQCRSYGNTAHGFYITGNDANACVFTLCHGSTNGGDGFFSEKTESGVNPAWNTYLGCTAETNTGYGIHLKGGANNSINGGDYEANTAGDIFIESTEQRSALFCQNTGSVVTDNGFLTRRLDRAVAKTITFTGAIRGASGSDVTATAVTISGATATIEAAGHGYSNSDVVFHAAFSNPNLNGAFVISNVSADTYDITFRTDASATAPTSATGLSVATRKCGAYTTNVCSYTLCDGYVLFDMHLVTSSVTNISGAVTLTLPFASVNLSNYFAAVALGYMAGITATNNMGIIIGSNTPVALLYEDIGGTPGTPSQLQGTGLAAATTIVCSGRYRIPTTSN